MLQCRRLCPPNNNDWGRLRLGGMTLMIVKVVVTMEGVTHVNFTGAPLYFLKKIQMHNNPTLERVVICFSVYGC